ncbi:MAG: transcriptional regulator [Ferroplasma sp.]
MDNISGNAEKVYNALKSLGAVSEAKLKTADDIMKKAGLAKSAVNAGLMELIDKKMARRIARQKSAGYYLIQ